ncbi:hypothetical protein GCM10010967_19070 [Dyadobacter beijingensis]|uniref:Uncharacterized protein n=1 Tax=Dyadobacter beijingensis TaxID=365489 RepID=A0ABQ2HN87_9BACT|nr:hypothetical protein GCM10010967_19070 [Dyadobacter beijingensis]
MLGRGYDCYNASKTGFPPDCRLTFQTAPVPLKPNATGIDLTGWALIARQEDMDGVN